MTEEQIKEATEINKQIERLNVLLNRIERLMNNNKVFCHIDMPKQSIRKRLISSHYSENTDLIKKILKNDRIELQRNKSVLLDKLKQI